MVAAPTAAPGDAAAHLWAPRYCARSNPLKPDGEWVTKIDLREEKGQLQLAAQPTHGKCQRECRTIEEACNNIIDKARQRSASSRPAAPHCASATPALFSASTFST